VFRNAGRVLRWIFSARGTGGTIGRFAVAPRTPFAFKNQICRFARCGTRSRSGCRLISWSASWPTCSGKRWTRSAAKPAWETNRGKSSTSEIALVDVVLPTRNGITLRKRCIGQPNQHQLVLLQHLGWKLPSIPEIAPV
jgi:hypothetical protein